MSEIWRTVDEFPRYEISDKGNVYNTHQRKMMRISRTREGHAKITLTDFDGDRRTRSVALLVAQAFVRPPNFMSDHLIMLDGDLENLSADNLAWRPRWFAWKYTHQLKVPQRLHYRNLRVRNVTTGQEYDSIIEAGIAEGLLFENIWRSTYQHIETYPYKSVFEIVQREENL